MNTTPTDDRGAELFAGAVAHLGIGADAKAIRTLLGIDRQTQINYQRRAIKAGFVEYRGHFREGGYWVLLEGAKIPPDVIALFDPFPGELLVCPDVKQCPQCDVKAVGIVQIGQTFNWRKRTRKGVTKRLPQSWCNECRNAPKPKPDPNQVTL